MHKLHSITLTAAGAMLARLKAIGVDYIFANSGTDFPPIIEGLAEAAAKDVPLPQALVMPHENAAMGMAHGYYLATGRAQAVMAHTNVGLANCATGALNAAVENVPVLLFSGRTPVTEAGRFGARTVPIGWGQEMRDQTALIREAVKWDYELRFPEQAGPLVDRAYAIANSTPKGPVYVALPREVLCEDYPAGEDLGAPLVMQPATVTPAPSQIEALADLVGKAQFPIILAQHGAGSDEAFAALGEIADRFSIPVCHYWAVQIAIATDHPMYAGVDPSWLLERADLVLVLDSLAPWSQQQHAARPDATVVHMGPDPLKARMPIRNFRSDISIPCELADGILALAAALATREPAHAAARRDDIVERNGTTRAQAIKRAEAGRDGTMSADYVALRVSEALAGRNAVLLSERGCPMPPMTLGHYRAWYQEPHAGGLGWSFPAALGMQLAEPDRLIVATMGDGSYMFANPVACHQIAEALELPVLVIVMNNAEWAAVRHSVLDIYPDGYASKTNLMPLTGLSPIPDFVKVAEASRAWTRKVDNAAALDEALAAALAHVAEKRTLALLDISIRN